MTTYTVYLPPDEMSENEHEDFRLVPDAKATLALLFPPFWLAWHRLWLPLMVYIVVLAAIILFAVSSPSIAVSYLSILPGLYLLLEGYQLVRSKLERDGWRYAGTVDGENREEAEIRFIVTSPHMTEKPDYLKSGRSELLRTGSAANQINTGLFPE